MPERTVFTFWEPPGAMPAYLRLCLRTWERHLRGTRVVVLTYANRGAWFDPSPFPREALERLPLKVQKEAMMVGALREHGGVFLDADTLAFGDLAPLLEGLRRSEALCFENHLAFLAARPRARLLEAWAPRIAARLRNIPAEPGWGYLGNEILAELLEEEIEGLGLLGGLQTRALEAGFRLASRLAARAPVRFQKALAARRQALRYRRWAFFRRTLLKGWLGWLPRTEGYIAEARHFAGSGIDPMEQYRRFWFDPALPLSAVTAPGPVLVGLHHSQTPAGYCALDEAQVLAHPSLLSRCLRMLLRT